MFHDAFKKEVDLFCEDLQAAQQTQKQLASNLGVGQDTISRLEKRSDMLTGQLGESVVS